MNTKRFLLCIYLIFFSSFAFSLGLGNISVFSFLNESFRADIPLIDFKHVSLNTIQVKIASPDEYKKIALERVGELDFLKFTIQEKNGHAFIHVTSAERITEPYIQLLIDVSWPSGEIYRAYTVLLDPPSYVKQKERRLVTKKHSFSSDQTRISHHQDSLVKEIPTTSQPLEETEYHATQTGQTIWQISQRYLTESTTLAQTVLAIVGKNPEAFISGNLNGLKPGAILKFPSQTEILQVSKALADAEVTAHDVAWKNKTSIVHVISPPYISEPPLTDDKAKMDAQSLLRSSLIAVPLAFHETVARSFIHPTTLTQPRFLPTSIVGPVFISYLPSLTLGSIKAPSAFSIKKKPAIIETNLPLENTTTSMFFWMFIFGFCLLLILLVLLLLRKEKQGVLLLSQVFQKMKAFSIFKKLISRYYLGLEKLGRKAEDENEKDEKTPQKKEILNEKSFDVSGLKETSPVQKKPVSLESSPKKTTAFSLEEAKSKEKLQDKDTKKEDLPKLAIDVPETPTTTEVKPVTKVIADSTSEKDRVIEFEPGLDKKIMTQTIKKSPPKKTEKKQKPDITLEKIKKRDESQEDKKVGSDDSLLDAFEIIPETPLEKEEQVSSVKTLEDLKDFTFGLEDNESSSPTLSKTPSVKDTSNEPEEDTNNGLVKSNEAFDTVLALAETYAAMGDTETALQSLEEVLEYGDEKQKKAANNLLKDIQKRNKKSDESQQ